MHPVADDDASTHRPPTLYFRKRFRIGQAAITADSNSVLGDLLGEQLKPLPEVLKLLGEGLKLLGERQKSLGERQSHLESAKNCIACANSHSMNSGGQNSDTSGCSLRKERDSCGSGLELGCVGGYVRWVFQSLREFR